MAGPKSTRQLLSLDDDGVLQPVVDSCHVAVLPTADGSHLLIVSGPIDIASARQLHDAIHDALAGGGVSVRVDTSPVTFFDAAGVRALWRGAAEARRCDVALRLVAVSDAVRKVLELTEADRWLNWRIDEVTRQFACRRPRTTHSAHPSADATLRFEGVDPCRTDGHASTAVDVNADELLVRFLELQQSRMTVELDDQTATFDSSGDESAPVPRAPAPEADPPQETKPDDAIAELLALAREFWWQIAVVLLLTLVVLIALTSEAGN